MKKILILVDNIGPKKELFAEGIASGLGKNKQLVMARFSDLVFFFEKGKVEVTISGINKNIINFDLVYFRRAGKGFSVLAGSLAPVLDFLKVKYFDTAWREIGPVGSKLTNLLKLAIANQPISPSVYCWQNDVKANINRIVENLGYPMVAKELGAQRGGGVFLIKRKEDFFSLPLKIGKRSENSQYLFQKYLEKKIEYRLLVLKDKVWVAETKTATKRGEFRNNVALGAKEEFLDVNTILPQIQKIAVDAALALKIQIAGVDVAIDESNTPWLLEVNRGPGITYDQNISPELKEIASFFNEELENLK